MERGIIDLASLDTTTRASEGVEMEILGVKDEPTGAFLRIYGVDSAAYRKALMDLREKQGERELTQEELVEQDIEFAERLTGGWRNVIVDGQELPFGPENARMLYRRCPVIRRQVMPFAVERSNFFLK